VSELTIRAMTPEDWPAVRTIYGEVIGWVAAQRVSARQVYAGVLETSIYVAGRAPRVGVGRALLRALI
jgi:phosphinothricin acetyltransferase